MVLCDLAPGHENTSCHMAEHLQKYYITPHWNTGDVRIWITAHSPNCKYNTDATLHHLHT